ncbi:unnamed protein product [Anisakis simplex]|uniref:ethanolamine kinase n=1 Tax=Anisakis simplex TaxID=6269 RepID=A0A0M3JVD6_ANISI|nr:unnamed protein product [Anisakis simplex]
MIERCAECYDINGMSISNIPFFNIELPLTDDISLVARTEEILAKLRPDWNFANISFKCFTTGITNKIVCATNSSANEIEPSERVLFRVFGRNTEKIIDRRAELENWLRLAEVGCAAPVYAKFINGIVCGYLEGRTITVEDVREEKIITLAILFRSSPSSAIMLKVHFEVERSMAKLHSLEPSDHTIVKPILFEKGEKMLRYFSTKFENSAKQQEFDAYFTSNKISLEDDFKNLKKSIDTLEARVVFCHNDLLLHNIIYDSKTGKVSFIDYEYAGFNYQGFDIANHFCEYAGVENVDYTLCPSTEQKRAWISLYLTFLLDRPPSADAVERMLQDNEIFEAVYLL